MTLDLPTLNCWLRARVGGKWQPPTLLKVEPLKRPKSADVERIIREVIAAHPNDYVLDTGMWQLNVIDALKSMIPENLHFLFDLAYTPEKARANREEKKNKKQQEQADAEKAVAAGKKADKKERKTLRDWT